MKEAVLQRRGLFLVPFSNEDGEAIKEFLENQPIRAKLTGAKKPRSYRQLSAYKKCCRKVAENLEGKDEHDVDFNVKWELKYLKEFRIVNGVTVVEVDSVSYDRLDHLEACNFFGRAFPLLAKMIKVTVEELLKHAEAE